MVENPVIPISVRQKITSQQAHRYGILPFAFEEGILKLYVNTETFTLNLQQELEIILGMPVELIKKREEFITPLIIENYRSNQQQNIKKLNYSDNFLNQLIHEAREINSSDIHFEIYEKRCRIRFRIDGHLVERYEITKEQYPSLLNQIKIIGGLDISEKRLPQDGRMSIKLANESFDIRVSTLPSLYGEKVVLRLLAGDAGNMSLSELGFVNEDLKVYQDAIKKPNGIILISGPTGSGKTTTLYATLKTLNSENRNILTIEDPIEYTLEGVNQVQLKEQIGLSFSSAMRSFLRQDPDIIMVGEIRDLETAQMAIRASLTGHLVFSTIHTNSSYATLSRLTDMGIPEFLLAETMNMSLAQRLVRKLCTNCKEEQNWDDNLLPKAFQNHKFKKDVYYKHKGCSKCFYTGYSGRIAIYEMLPMNESLATSIRQTHQLPTREWMKKNKLFLLSDRAFDLLCTGQTSLEEVYPLMMQ